ncbi:ABC transporter permease [Pseudonocardia abyssalis]|jgi:peptide/nickel transport system permease protein|uniref:ABC transporter permease n=1 Tax=Pseudonocardia abyssalis TaxID=2792008 RepID=A0ABS6UNC9_9PSEU|nr:ABC transporter permease [Pseudonocardia abyssalis]MBW0115102.1 ABC transporter permease [Pseudonocardia abyssalis]MBW0133758.1 ABC transporter permease [Pseudonocardia abyssalis]
MTTTSLPGPVTGRPEPPPGVVSPRRRTLRLLLSRPSSVVAFGFVLLLVALAALAPWVSPHDPFAQDLTNAFAPYSAEHPLGTDDLGRDVVSRLMHAIKLALLAPLISVGVALVLGVPTGLWAGLSRGYVDAVLSRIADALLSLPGLAFALAIIAVVGPGLVNVMVALGVVFTPTLFRVIRGAAMAVSEEPFIDAARSIGCSTSRILRVHVLPNVAAPLLVQATILMGLALLSEAGLSFLGLGVQPPESSWGSMLRTAYENQFEAPTAVLPPGIAVVLTVLAFNTIGDAIRDAMSARGQR